MGIEWELRLMLVLGALGTLLYFLHQIRKSRLQIDFAIFWSFFATGLLILGIFPQIGLWASALVGFESPANMVFLIVIFVLLLKLFTNTVKLSRMNRQIVHMAQHIALMEKKDEDQKSKTQIENKDIRTEDVLKTEKNTDQPQ